MLACAMLACASKEDKKHIYLEMVYAKVVGPEFSVQQVALQRNDIGNMGALRGMVTPVSLVDTTRKRSITL